MSRSSRSSWSSTSRTYWAHRNRSVWQHFVADLQLETRVHLSLVYYPSFLFLCFSSWPFGTSICHKSRPSRGSGLKPPTLLHALYLVYFCSLLNEKRTASQLETRRCTPTHWMELPPTCLSVFSSSFVLSFWSIFILYRLVPQILFYCVINFFSFNFLRFLFVFENNNRMPVFLDYLLWQLNKFWMKKKINLKDFETFNIRKARL